MPTSIPSTAAGLLVLAATFLPAAGSPAMLHRLHLHKLEKTPFLLTYRSHTAIDGVKPDDRFAFRVESINKAKIREQTTSDFLRPRSNLFTQGPYRNRFVLHKVVFQKALNQRLGALVDEYVATIEDTRPGKAGTLYQVKKGSRNAVLLRDFAAVLEVPAGDETRILSVDENVPFALPFGSRDPADRRYTFHLLRPANAKDPGPVIRYTVDGEVREHPLALPKADDN